MAWFFGILLVGLGALFYVLHDRGYLSVKSMRAILFVGTMGAGKEQADATFIAATGQIRRVLRFRESKPYVFTLEGEIKKGTVTVYVLDSNRVPELVLDHECPSGNLPGVKGQKYYLMIRFQNADGKYTLTWK